MPWEYIGTKVKPEFKKAVQDLATELRQSVSELLQHSLAEMCLLRIEILERKLDALESSLEVLKEKDDADLADTIESIERQRSKRKSDIAYLGSIARQLAEFATTKIDLREGVLWFIDQELKEAKREVEDGSFADEDF